MSAIPDVLETTRRVVEQAGTVEIDPAAIRAWVATHADCIFAPPTQPAELHFQGNDEECAHLALLLSCMNFCFWSPQPWSVRFREKTWTRTHAMYASILRAVEQDRSWLLPARWAQADEQVVGTIFQGDGRIPLVHQRRMVLNETGLCLLTGFDGRFSNLLDQAGGHARRVAELLALRFPSFRDIARYQGEAVALLKRAQLCAAEIHRLWQAGGHGAMHGLDELTLFADYRLPQYLRHTGILVLQCDLAERIDQLHEIPAGSPEEVELRSATVVAGDLMRQAFPGNVPAWHLDFMLWQRAHDPEVTVPHHRTTTIYY